MLKEHEVLFNQLESYRKETLSLVEEITEEEADFVPAGFNNNIRWNLGHIYLDQFLWLQLLTKEPAPIPSGYKEWFDFGTSPAQWKSSPPSLEELRQRLAEQPRVIRELYGNQLEEVFPEIVDGIHTIPQVLVRTIFHEGMHIGAMIAIKRFIRK